MGWCHSTEAGRTLARIEAACEKSREGSEHTSSNVFVARGKAYFYEVARRDQKDNGICGTVHVMWTESDGREMARQVGGFRIGGNGAVLRGPALFKEAAACK